MKVTNGLNTTDVVPLAVRYPMLQMWVLIKQLLQQQIGKALGTTSAADEEVITIIQVRLLAENPGKRRR